MKEAERVAEALRWLRYAQEDLDTAGRLAGGSVPRQVCWLSQQSVEKALKAVLILTQVEFPRTHDLDVLLHLIPDGWAVRAENPDLAELSEWAVEARYPGSWPEASPDDAAAAVTTARHLYDLVRQGFDSRV